MNGREEVMDEVLGADKRRLAVTFQIDEVDPQGLGVQRVLETMLDAFPVGHPNRPSHIHLALSRLPFSILEERIGEWTRQPTEEEMALVKHGEGNVIPESEQQRTAARQDGMSESAREALRAENEEADGVADHDQ